MQAEDSWPCLYFFFFFFFFRNFFRNFSQVRFEPGPLTRQASALTIRPYRRRYAPGDGIAPGNKQFVYNLLSYHNNSISCLCLGSQIVTSISYIYTYIYIYIYIYIYSYQTTGNCLNLSSDEILFHLNICPSIYSILVWV